MKLKIFFALFYYILQNCWSAENVKHSKSFVRVDTKSGLYDDWWQAGVFYEIYPRSFKDSDNDGNGDLRGIIQKLDDLSSMGITSFWLTPIYQSPQRDGGYDISNYRDIDSLYGSLSDLRELVDEAHERNLKVILDYVPNHTSDQHEWFQNSVKGIDPYSNYYIWQNATYVDGKRSPPNNWLSNFKGSAWEWNEERQQYYYHQFLAAQPDLNYRSPAVIKEMKDVLKYWLDFGIDGFRMDAVLYLFEDELLRDEPSSDADVDSDDPASLDHIYTMNLNDTYDMIYQWRELLDEFTVVNGTYTRIMMTEAYTDLEHTMRYYVNEDYTRYGAHFTFNFITFIENIKKGYTGNELAGSIFDWLSYLPVNATPNWVLGNHDQPRLATRLGTESIDALNMVLGMLPGIQVNYMGEELGQQNGEVTCEQGYDLQAKKNCSTFNETSRDFERTPYQWDSTENAGFTNGTPWLPVSEQYNITNLALQNMEGSKSHFHIYQNVSQVRKAFKNTSEERLTWGSSENIFFLERESENAHYLMVFNVEEADNLIQDPSFLGDDIWKIVLTDIHSTYNIGDVFNATKPMGNRESLILKVADS